MSYEAFASYYDGLMQNVGYEKRAEYFCSLAERVGHTPGLALDLACGTGSLTLALARRGWDIYGVDASPAMLSVAQEKAAQEGVSLLFLCQPMQKLDLYGTVNTVICTLDSLNHLTEEEELAETFRRVSLFLEPGGWFFFDTNTIYKHREILKDHVFVFDTDEVYCVWQNQYDPAGEKEQVEITLDFFEKQGDKYLRSREQFYERAYPTATLCRLLQEAGLEPVHRFEDLTFDPPAADSQRMVYAARKHQKEE